MDWAVIRKKVTEWISKYRYVLLVLLIGLAFMLIPSGFTKDKAETAQTQPPAETQKDITDELTEIIGMIEGAGRVKVMLTVAAGETTVFQQDEDISSGENGSIRRETVIVADSDRKQSGLVQQVNPPQYLGAIIVCEGADRAAVRLSIIEAVSKATGLGSDRISVLKMK